MAKIISFNTKNKLFKEKTRKIGKNVKPDCVKMISNLIETDERNKLLIDIKIMRITYNSRLCWLSELETLYVSKTFVILETFVLLRY